MEAIRPIQPELLAAKIEKIQNFEYPELLEQFSKEPQLISALWFLQFVSQPTNHAGGLSRFASDFIIAQSHKIGTARMAKAKPKAGRYALTDAIAILRELSDDARSSLFGDDSFLIGNEFIGHGAWECWSDDPSSVAPEKPLGRRECKSLLIDRLTPRAVLEICKSEANEQLAKYFKEACELPHVALRGIEGSGLHSINGPPWYFANVADALLAFMRGRAEGIRSSIADTEITQLVTRWIQKSRNTKQSVMIIGNSRFGKTEAVKMNADIAPGSCRYVETPEFTAVSDLLHRVAAALGIEAGIHCQTRELRERIEYVLRLSGLQILLDESHRLLPASFSRNTAPARLNWVRSSMMDRDIPVVFVCTPQSYIPAKKRFVNATGYALEQFEERILKTVELPKVLNDDDLLAVAKIHFPNLHPEYQHYVAEHVSSAERNFVSDIKKIALLSKDIAQDAGRKLPILADIKAAMAEVLPSKQQPAPAVAANDGGKVQAIAPAQKARPKPAIQRPCKTPAEPLPMPRRGLDTLSQDRFSRPAEVPA